jgi:hypothetical protein
MVCETKSCHQEYQITAIDIESIDYDFPTGLGDTGEGWRDSALELQRKLPYMKFILPTAPFGPGISTNS